MSFKVTGRITVLETGIPIPTLRVHVWDRDLVFDDDLGEVTTDADGYFEHSFERSDFDDFGIEPYPDLYLIISTADGRVLVDTSPKTRYNASELEHFEIRVPTSHILEGDGALFWAVRPRVTGTLSVHEGDTSVPAYIGDVAKVLDSLLIELWDPAGKACLAVDEPSKMSFSLWYWIGDYPGIRELELRVRLGAEGKEIFRSRRFGVSLDTQVQNIDLQRRVLLGVETHDPFEYSHTNVADHLLLAREPREVISVSPAPVRREGPLSAASLSPFASPTLPAPPSRGDATEDQDDAEPAPPPFRMKLPPRPTPIAKVGEGEE